MFCSQCGTHADDGAHFCNSCGASLQAPGGIAHQQPAPYSPYQYSQPPASPPRAVRRSSSAKPQDPYSLQIKQLKLQIRQLKLDLKQINTEMSTIRSRHNQSAGFMPRGFFKEGSRMFEDMRLMGPQNKKQQLQQQIMQLEQELLSLQQQQQQWQQG
ncbi:MAG: zinc ribbon domain-containing protein [Ktedonobacteraceae bacterium]